MLHQHLENSLLQTPWKQLQNEYYYKFVANESHTCFKFVISNLEKVWSKFCDEEEIVVLSDVYCPQLSMETKDLVKLIEKQLADPEDTTTTYEIQKNADFSELTVSIKATLQLLAAKVSIPFHWRIVCSSLNTMTLKEKLASSLSKTISASTSVSQNVISISSFDDSASPSLGMESAGRGSRRKGSNSVSSLTSEEQLLEAANISEESKFLKQHLVDPLLGMVKCLNSEVEGLRQLLVKKDKELMKFREMYGGAGAGGMELFDIVNHEDKVLKRAPKEFEKSSLNSMSKFLTKLYTAYTTNATAPSATSASSSSDSQTSNPSQKQLPSPVVAGGGNAFSDSQKSSHEEEEPPSPAPAHSALSITSSQGAISLSQTSAATTTSVYQESENEKKRKREIEQEMQAKRQRKEKQTEKKKIKKAFF